MGLPIQSAPTYTTKLPSDGREVKFRPFLVKEQKILVLAREGEDTERTLDAVKELIHNVTFEKVVADELPMVDLEWLFIKIRAVSVGEHVTLTLSCQHETCNGTGKVVLNLEEVGTKGEIPEDTTIKISDDVGVVLRFPMVKDLSGVDNLPVGEQPIELVKRSMVQIFDGETVYNTNEIEQKELDEFVDSLTFKQLETIGGFFDNLPKLSHDITYMCDVCKVSNERTLEGLQSFF